MSHSVSTAAESAVHSILSGERNTARKHIASINTSSLLEDRRVAKDIVWGTNGVGRGYKAPKSGVKRESVRAADQRFVFERDAYTCRYAHCERRTIAPDVLKLLSKCVPDLMPYHSNWKPLEDHALYWTYCTSLEHIESFPHDGTSEKGNLITSCYQCNDIKNYLPLELLGWTISDPKNSDWKGLTEWLPKLRKVAKEQDSSA